MEERLVTPGGRSPSLETDAATDRDGGADGIERCTLLVSVRNLPESLSLAVVQVRAEGTSTELQFAAEGESRHWSIEVTPGVHVVSLLVDGARVRHSRVSVIGPEVHVIFDLSDLQLWTVILHGHDERASLLLAWEVVYARDGKEHSGGTGSCWMQRGSDGAEGRIRAMPTLKGAGQIARLRLFAEGLGFYDIVDPVTAFGAAGRHNIQVEHSPGWNWRRLTLTDCGTDITSRARVDSITDGLRLPVIDPSEALVLARDGDEVEVSDSGDSERRESVIVPGHPQGLSCSPCWGGNVVLTGVPGHVRRALRIQALSGANQGSLRIPEYVDNQAQWQGVPEGVWGLVVLGPGAAAHSGRNPMIPPIDLLEVDRGELVELAWEEDWSPGVLVSFDVELQSPIPVDLWVTSSQAPIGVQVGLVVGAMAELELKEGRAQALLNAGATITKYQLLTRSPGGSWTVLAEVPSGVKKVRLSIGWLSSSGETPLTGSATYLSGEHSELVGYRFRYEVTGETGWQDCALPAGKYELGNGREIRLHPGQVLDLSD